MEFLFVHCSLGRGIKAVPSDAFPKEISSNPGVWLRSINIVMSEEHRFLSGLLSK